MKNRMLLPVIFILIVIPMYAFCWTAPLGIPTPTWPSDLDLATPKLPNPWTSEQSGYYYVENTGGCSDSRTYGYPGSPRCNPPSSPSAPSAGSVIALHGTYPSSATFGWTGTSRSPIWIRAYNAGSKPTITNPWEVTGNYIILESLNFNCTENGGNLGLLGNHIMVRNCSFRDPYGFSYGSGVGIIGSYIIFYLSSVYDQGNWQASTEIDRHGVKIESGASDVWFVDSAFYHCQGDGIQVGDHNNTASQIQRIYIGRSTAYENLQTCFWTKNATDVIMSQNICHDIPFSVGSAGQGMGGQYDPVYVWFLFNKIYNAKAGILIVGASRGGGGPWYALGNVIYNVQSDTCNEYDYGALGYRNDGGFYAFHNTIYNVDAFVTLTPSGHPIVIKDNIFATQRIQSCPAINTPVVAPTMDYNLYQSDSYVVAYGGSSYKTVSAFASGKGQESHRKVGNPNFTNPPTAFTLQSNSPCIGSANQSIEEPYTTYSKRYGISIQYDFAGNSRPQGRTWDIGAYEFVGSNSTPPVAPRSLRIQQ
jgi:hypothetical protein